MEFRVGDKVVHPMYGPGEILRLEEKELAGQTQMCYVLQVKDLTLWVPVDRTALGSLRMLTTQQDFEELFAVLRETPQPVSPDRFERKVQLTERLRDGTLRSVCEVVRDLTHFRRAKKINDVDASILERAQNFLLSEWRLAFSIPVTQAERELKTLLEEGAAILPEAE